MTKTEIKRRKSMATTLRYRLKPMLKGFKNRYMGGYLEWHMDRYRVEAARYPGLNTMEDFLNKFEGMPFKTAGLKTPEPSRYNRNPSLTMSHNVCYELYRVKDSAIAMLEHEYTSNHSFLAEAHAGYEDKFTKLINKLVESGIRYDHPSAFSVESIRGCGDEFAFMVKDDKISVHARMIYAHGEINKPHYRFITTVKKIK